MATLLGALLRNESGGRNIPNVHQGTSSGQAQGYFQITTGTWDEFGGRKYAPNPLAATYEQQAEIASQIPLRRWDKSTLAQMRATGRQIDPNRTLGENLAMHGETFQGGARDGGATAQAPQTATVPQYPGMPPISQPTSTPENQWPATTQKEQFGPQQPASPYGPQFGPPMAPADQIAGLDKKAAKKSALDTLAEAVSGISGGKSQWAARPQYAQPRAARVDDPDIPTVAAGPDDQRNQLSLLMAKLNSGKLWM